MKLSKVHFKELSKYFGPVRAYKKVSSWRQVYKVRLEDRTLVRVDLLKLKDKTTSHQQRAIDEGCDLFPEIKRVFSFPDCRMKVSSWEEGELFSCLHESGNLESSMMFQLGKSVGHLNSMENSNGYNLHNDDITMRNVVWVGHPVIFDLDRLKYYQHVDNSLVKVLLKRIIRKDYMDAFIEGYKEHRDVSNLCGLCESRDWKWKRG